MSAIGINEMVRRRVGFTARNSHQEDHRMRIEFIGIDLGKTTFHLIALGEHNKVLVRKKFSRGQLLVYTASERNRDFSPTDPSPFWTVLARQGNYGVLVTLAGCPDEQSNST
jgi:hypothetical protein